MATKITKHESAAPVTLVPHGHCGRCGARWMLRVATPVKCPRCQGALATPGRVKLAAAG